MVRVPRTGTLLLAEPSATEYPTEAQVPTFRFASTCCAGRTSADGKLNCAQSPVEDTPSSVYMTVSAAAPSDGLLYRSRVIDTGPNPWVSVLSYAVKPKPAHGDAVVAFVRFLSKM